MEFAKIPCYSICLNSNLEKKYTYRNAKKRRLAAARFFHCLRLT